MVATSYKVDRVRSKQRLHFINRLGSLHPEDLGDGISLSFVEDRTGLGPPCGRCNPGVDQLADGTFVLAAVLLQLSCYLRFGVGLVGPNDVVMNGQVLYRYSGVEKMLEKAISGCMYILIDTMSK